MPPFLPPPVFTFTVVDPPAWLLGLRTESASLGTAISAIATHSAITASTPTTFAPVGPITDRAVSDPSAKRGAPAVRAVTEYACRIRRRNNLGRATVNRPGTRTVAPGGTRNGPRETSTAVLYGERASRWTFSGWAPEFCRRMKNFLL